MDDYEMSQYVSSMLRDSRTNAGISRESMAKALQVSAKTVQNWEEGLSYPNVKHLVNWFQTADIPLYPFMLKLNNPELMKVNANSSDEEIKQAFINVIDQMDIKQMRQHFFEMFGETGTAPEGMGEVKTAYLHLPMHTKVGIAEIIATQFEISMARDELVKPDSIMPDLDKLHDYINKAKKAVIEGKETYL